MSLRRLLYVFVAVALVPLIAAGCADKLILRPRAGVFDPRGAERRFVPFRGGRLAVLVARSPGVRDGLPPQAYALEFCGNGTRAEWVASYVASRWEGRPVEVWALNYPGYGDSTGPARLAALPPSALAAYDALADAAGGKPIFLGGHSLGTAAALYVATRRPAAGLTLHNPPALRQLIVGKYGWWNLWLGAAAVAARVPLELDSVANAKKLSVPAVFLLADDDQFVPPKYHRMVVDAYAGPKRVVTMPGGHNTPVRGPALHELHAGMDWMLAAEPRAAPPPPPPPPPPRE